MTNIEKRKIDKFINDNNIIDEYNEIVYEEFPGYCANKLDLDTYLEYPTYYGDFDDDVIIPGNLYALAHELFDIWEDDYDSDIGHVMYLPKLAVVRATEPTGAPNCNLEAEVIDRIGNIVYENTITYDGDLYRLNR